jgi:hypothetical protein
MNIRGGSMRVIGSAVPVAIAMLCGRAFAQTGPTDTGLKAAYCLGVTKITQQVSSQMWTEMQAANAGTSQAGVLIHRDLNGQNDRLDRLRAYVLPKLTMDETMQIAIAAKRGENDALQLQRPEVLQCSSQCGLPDPNSPSEMAKIQIVSNRLRTCRAARLGVQRYVLASVLGQSAAWTCRWQAWHASYASS